MLILIVIFLFLILVSNLAILWLGFQRLPEEKQKEVLRKIEPIEGKVIEWEAPKSEEDIAFQEALKNSRR